jgi:hypothetical protein
MANGSIDRLARRDGKSSSEFKLALFFKRLDKFEFGI